MTIVPMRISLISWLFLIPLFQILLGVDIVLLSGQCLDGQRTLLLQLKNSLIFSSTVSTKLVDWNQTADCCHWNGVKCDNAGHVIILDLDNESIAGGIENSSSLFSLQFLQNLSLANNFFNYTQIPLNFNNLTSLVYLNLSNAGFAGQVPRFSNLQRLVTLDLSTLYFPGMISLKLETPNLRVFVRDLTGLIELYMDGVNISAQGNEWCEALSSSLPNLQVLSLLNCYLSGSIDSSLAKLRSLSVIRLSQNNLTAPVPEFFSNFTNLIELRLSFCNLYGNLPRSILQLPTLQTLDLSANRLLQGSLPEFPQNGSLRTLLLSQTNFSGAIHTSIGNLGMLTRMELSSCSFIGTLPNSMENLTRLLYLDLSSNMFTGPISSFRMSRNVTYIDLSHNDFTGVILSTHFESLIDLVYIDLRFNSLNGSIPSSLLALPSLQKLQLSNNLFDGQLSSFPHESLSQLDTLDLSSNNLWGPIPMSFFELRRLSILLLSSNNFTGIIRLEMIQRRSNLTTLDLSYNSLTIDARGINSRFSPFPLISRLKLASCNLKNFPDLKNQSKLLYLDLSDNQIGGEIPNWIWEVGNGALFHLNLSGNLLVGLQEPFIIPSLSVLDLHSNQLRGKIPVLPQTATYVDYSSNNFNHSIPADIGKNLTFAYFFSVSNNNLTGTIPESICNAMYLQVLDFSRNSLIGSIPSCLIEWKGFPPGLGVMNLGKNYLGGTISGTFQTNCSLKTLDLRANALEGKVPESLANCSVLEVLNIGNNKIHDTFPCFLKNSVNLRVLILRSNMFYGGLACQGANDTWPKIQIIDIASNKFTGDLPPKCFLNWRAMMNNVDDAQSTSNHLQFEFLHRFYYQDTVTVTNKGLEMELVKILTVFTSIDFSNNRFEGDIPETVGDLKALYVLNFSHNVLTGTIPSSIGNLTQLGSLDLSVNNLTGEIPEELTSLTFLSVLNLSYNQLVGKIPTVFQFRTFDQTSFKGNKGLCGLPSFRNCNDATLIPTSAPSDQEPVLNSRKQVDWKFIFTGLGFGVGAAVAIAPLIFWEHGRSCYAQHIDKLAWMILATFGFVYTNYDDEKFEAEKTTEEEPPDNNEESDKDEDQDEMEDKAFGGRYCVLCTKLDIYRKTVVHDPKCTCHSTPPIPSYSSSFSS